MPIVEEIVAGELPPPLWTDGDTPRVRRSSPAASHLAADRSQRRISKLRLAVLRVVSIEGPLIGADLNSVYADRYCDGAEFPICHWDSPRKRVGELAEDGLVDVIAHHHGTLEAVYRISVEGKRLLEKEAQR